MNDGSSKMSFVGGFNIGATASPVCKITDIQIGEHLKIKYKFAEESLNFLFGEKYDEAGKVISGMTPGSIVSAFGVKGVGKTTLFLGIAHAYGKTGKKVCYCSNEESAEQLASTAKRVSATELDACYRTELSDILTLFPEYDLLIVDSLQGVMIDGKPSNDAKAINAMVAEAKKYHCTLIIIAHANKSGTIKGGSNIEHIVDQTIGVFRASEEIKSDYYLGTNVIIVRTEKNRFGREGDLILERTPFGMDFGNCPNVLFYGSLMPLESNHIARN